MPERKAANFVPRVTQLDALELDQEVVRILKDQFVNIFKFSGSRFLSTWEPELDFLLNVFIWKFSVVKTHATFGQQLLGIKHGNDFNRKKAWLFAAIAFGTKYLNSRSVEISKVSSNRATKDVIHKIARYLEMGIQVSTLVNFLIFLKKGKYPTLIHRILGLTLVPIDPGKSRSIGYSYMTRELLWHGFIELLVFTLPLINYHSIKRRFIGIFVKKQNQKCENVKFTKDTLCPVCGDRPVLPQSIGCVHVYCYYCIKANQMADSQYECVICGFLPQSPVKPVEM